MQIDQRQVTAITLRDGRERDCLLCQEGAGYRLTLVSKDDVVNIFLSPRELVKLRQELARADVREIRKDAEHCQEPKGGWGVHEPCMNGLVASPVGADCVAVTWSKVDWLSYN